MSDLKSKSEKTSRLSIRMHDSIARQLNQLTRAAQLSPNQYLKNSFQQFIDQQNALARQADPGAEFKKMFAEINQAQDAIKQALAPLNQQFPELQSFAALNKDLFKIHTFQLPENVLRDFERLSAIHETTFSDLASKLVMASAINDFHLAEPHEHEEYDLEETEAEIITNIEIVAPSFKLMRALADQAISLYDVTWREFEEIVAELLDQDGYDVKLGQGTKDGGLDIFASKYMPGMGLVSSVWQAKHLIKSGNKVRLGVIRELADTRTENKASKGVIVTSTSLTKGALDRVTQDKYLLGKVDGVDLQGWLERTKK